MRQQAIDQGLRAGSRLRWLGFGRDF